MNVFRLCQLCKLNIKKSLVRMFYESTVLSVLSFSAVGWLDNITDELKKKLSRIEKTANKLIKDSGGRTLQHTHDNRMSAIAHRIRSHQDHPLSHLYQPLPSGKRLASIYASGDRYRNSFVPSSIRQLNGTRVWLCHMWPDIEKLWYIMCQCDNIHIICDRQ